MQARNLNQSSYSVGVGRYLGAPAEDCDFLISKLYEWLNGFARVTLWGRSKLMLEAVLGQMTLWRMRSRTRTHLSSLSDPMLKDIGLSRSDANREARKWFWEV